jgi:virulence factor Mce-like protein
VSTRARRLSARSLRALVVLVTAALVLSGCSIYDVPLPGGPNEGKNPIKVTVMFRDVLDLVPQSTVKVDDVTVGKVTKVALKGYVAKVTITLPRSVNLPDNAEATIRQTSLLGEKFVSLERPRNPSGHRLSNGDVIGLDHTGRNPEVEEVFGALALLLNGGGVGQLKTIATELNNAFGGRESDVRSVLDQIREFTGTLDDNKASVVAAIENTNRLAGQLRKQEGTIKSTLDDVPGALASINRQRDDLVRLLKSLTRLSSVGVKVIQASKASTIDSLQNLAPVLDSFAKAGENLPKSFQVFLTYPFVDAAVGKNPQVARNLHIGDYTNLSINLHLNLATVCNAAKSAISLAKQEAASKVIATLNLPAAQAKAVNDAVDKVIDSLDCQALSDLDVSKLISGFLNGTLQAVCSTLNLPTCPTIPPILQGLPPITVPPLPSVPNVLGGVTSQLPGGLGSSSGSGLGGILPRGQLGTAFWKAKQIDPFGLAAKGYDPGVGTLLFQGVATQR